MTQQITKNLVDASVILLLGSTGGDNEREIRRARTREFLATAKKDKRNVFSIAAPALAELCQHGHPTARSFAQKVMLMVTKSIRVASFDAVCAEAAVPILKESLSNRPKPATRDGDRAIVKYDVLIAATAIAHQFDRLLTANAAEFRKISALKANQVTVIGVDEVPDEGQMNLFTHRPT